MASTKIQQVPRTDDWSKGSRMPGDSRISAQVQPTSKQIAAVPDVRNDEARKRSEAVQAAIDIAAGW